MHKEALQATSVQTSLRSTGEERADPQLSSDALADFTVEADLGKSGPKDSLSQQQGNDEGTMNFSLDHIITRSNPSVLVDKTQSAEDRLDEIKWADLTELVKETGVEAIDLDSPKDDQPIQISSDDEAYIQAKVHTETKDASVLQPPPSLNSIKIQELSNQVLFIQSKKYKLEKEKVDVEAKAALLKAQPSFLNVQ
ncbi:hypothetical protein Tco_0455299 [Tanacetum coccineum]